MSTGWLDEQEAAIRERTGGTITLEQAKETLIRLLAGNGEDWHPYNIPRSEQRESVAGVDWVLFLECLTDVLDGKLDIR